MTVVRARAFPSLLAGLRAAASRPGLVAGLWAWQLLLATAAALPVYRGLVAATAQAPATDRLLEAFSFSRFAELLQYTALPVVQMVQMGAIGMLIVSVLVSPALLAMVVTAVDSPVAPPRGELAAAAGRWYGPLLRLVVFGRLFGLIMAGLVAGATMAALRPVRESLWEIGRLASGPATLLVALVPLALFFAAVDYAAIHAMRTGSRRMFAAWRMGLRASFRRPITTLGLWIMVGLLGAIGAALLLAMLGTLDGAAWIGIALAFVVQQLFVIFRIGLRVGLVGAEAATWRLVPDAAAPAPPQLSVEPAPEAPLDPVQGTA